MRGKDRHPARLRAKADELPLHTALPLRPDRRAHARTPAGDLWPRTIVRADSLAHRLRSSHGLGGVSRRGLSLLRRTLARGLGPRRSSRQSFRAKEDDALIYARRLVAERCLYGVDKNAFAVELAKLSLWLVTLQREKPFTFLDHNLRCGDSLVGCSFEQITAFHWNPAKQMGLFEAELQESLEEAIRARALIVERSPEDTPEANREMRTAMEDADDALSRLRTIGDLLIGAFFSAGKDKARENERIRRLDLISKWLGGDASAASEVESLVQETRTALRPFHWMVEFPEVFYAGHVDPLTEEAAEVPPYLDAVVGNPPFAGKNSISEAYGGSVILDWLKVIHPGSHGNADLCAHFFRRMDSFIGEHGTIGLIATNTIAQGDTRSTGLQYLVRTGLVIYEVTESMPWPGEAAVTISVVHLAKGAAVDEVGTVCLNGLPAQVINSRLRPKPERADPVRLAENQNCSFVGTYVLGMGFTLTPEERDILIERNPRNAERIFPYLGGQEVNTSPAQKFDRYVISFGQMSLEEAERWPDLLDIVREKVKPDRDRNKREVRRKYWWRFGEVAPALYAAIAPIDRCLVTALTSKHRIFDFVDKSVHLRPDSCTFFPLMLTHSSLRFKVPHPRAVGVASVRHYAYGWQSIHRFRLL